MVIYIWLLNSLVQSIASTVDGIEMVKDVWEKLRRTYDGVENNLRIFQIKGEIDDTVQGKKTVQEYATELERLWLDYDHFSKRTSCGDPKCKERHMCLQERTMKFLKGLTAAFAQRTALLLAQPEIPSLEEAISAMIQEETRIRLQTGTCGPPEAKSALAAASSGDTGSKGELWQHNRQCYNCGEMGHHRYVCTKPPKEGDSGGGRGRGYIGRGRGRGGRRGVREGYLVVEGNGGAGGTFTDEDQAFLNLLERKQGASTEGDMDGSPSKLTPDMLHGGALRSMEEIDTSKFSSVQDIGTTSDPHLPIIGSFSSEKVDMVEEKGRSKFSTLGVKLASETNGLKNASTPSTDANPGRRSTYSVVSAAPPQSKRPYFQMSAPEDSLELDDDDYNTTNLASPLTKENSAAELKKPEPQNVISETTASEAALKMPEKNNIVSETSSSEAELKIPNHKEVVYETAISEGPLVSSSQSIAVSSSVLFRESGKKAFAQPLVSEKGTGFTFPITSPTPLLNQPAFQMEAILKKLDADDVATLMKLIKMSAGDSTTRASSKLELPSIDLKLDGPATYLSWSRRVRRILAGKNLEGFLTGEKTEPEEGSTGRDEWKSTHMVIYIWLLNSLAQSIASTVDGIEMVQDVWEKLRRTYDGVENNLRIFQIKGEIDDTVQGKKTVQEYATELERLWLDYDHFSKRTSCGDPKCKERHMCLQERTMKFLKGLTAAFAQRTALLLAQPEIPSLEEAISAMIQEETRIRLQTGTCGPPEAKSALAAASSGDTGSKGELWQHNRQCYNCGEMGHHRYVCTKPPKEEDSGGGRGRGYIGRGRGRGGRRGVRGGYLVVEGNGGAGGTFTDEDQAFLNLLERKQGASTEGDMDGSPSKLTPDMLHGGALRSMEEIDTSKFSSVQDIGTTSDPHLPIIGSFSSEKVDMVEEKGRSKFSTLGVKLASETNGLKNASTPSTDANPGRRSTYSVVSAAPPQSKRPYFQMSAPEDSLELDDDDYNTTNLASPLTKENSAAELKKPEPQNVISETTASEAALKMPEKKNIVSETSSSEAELKIPNHKEVVYETAISESPLVSSSQSIAVSSSVLFRESGKKAFAQPLVSEKGTGFTFPITSDNCSHSQQPPAPIEPTPLLNQPAFQKEQTSLFSSGSSAANIFAVSSTTVGVNGSAGVKVDAGTGSELKSSSSDATSTSAEGSNLIKAGQTQKAGDLFKSFEHVSSGLAMPTTSALFSFGASTTTQGPSNGSFGGPSSTSSLSMSLGTTQSETPTSSIFLSGTAAKTDARPSFSSAAPVFSTVPSFQFGSGAPNATSLDKSKLSALEAEPAKTSPFSISNSTALGTSVFPVTSSSYSTAFTSSSSGSAPVALTTSGINSSTTSSSSTLGTSSLFSSMGANSSSFALSAPGSGSSIFGFSGSTQSSSSSSSLANSNSQNSTTTFGATGGSIFGAQPIHSANGTSLMSKSSTSHLTSFSSSPTFGLNSFGVMAGGSPPSGAKPFTPSPGFSVSTGASPAANTSSSFVPVATSALFGSSSQASTSSIFGSTSSSSTSSSTGFSFGLSAPGSGSSTSISTTSSPTTGFSFGQSASGSGSSPFMFGSSSFPSFGSSSGQASGSVFSFTSANSTASSTPASTQPPFGVPNPAIGFGSVISGSPGNDQMNVEDTMTDDTNQAPSFPTFGQPANHTASPFTFGSPAVQPGGPPVFQFGSHQNPSVPQNPPQFQTPGNLELPQGGSFSLGSGGGDNKAGRKYVRVARSKQRKK